MSFHSPEILPKELTWSIPDLVFLTHWKRPRSWEGLKVGGEGDSRGWDGWMASLTPWMWVWINSRSWWWTGRPGVLQSVGSQRVGNDWVTELNWRNWIQVSSAASRLLTVWAIGEAQKVLVAKMCQILTKNPLVSAMFLSESPTFSQMWLKTPT